MIQQPIEKNLFYQPVKKFTRHFWLVPGIFTAGYFGWLIAGTGFTVAGILLVMPFLIGYLVLVFLYPRVGLISFLVYCFLVPGLGRHIVGPQFGLLVDALLILTWMGVIFYRGNKYRFRFLNNDLIWLGLVCFW